MSPPTPPSPPIISRHGRDEDEHKTSSSSRSHHRTARDYRASRSRSRGRGRSSRLSPERERRYKRRSHSRSRSRDATTSRYARRHRVERSSSRHRYERSPSRSKGRIERPARSSNRSRSRSYSKSHNKTSHRSKSRSRSHSRSRKRANRSRSGSKSNRERHPPPPPSQSKRREGIAESSNKQANVIVLSTESYKDSLKSNSRLPSVREEPTSSSSSSSSSSTATKPPMKEETPSWKKAKLDHIGVYSNLELDAPIDKEKIHKEIEEKLRLVLAREGKVYPYPKPEPSHPVFANDGSFLEIFKKMQQQQTFVQQQVGESMQIHAVPATPVTPIMPAAPIHQPPPPQLPIFGRRRGGKILKTGVVAKPSSSNDNETGDVKDFWSIYLREVKKYKSTACESDSKTRPLVR